MHESEHEALRHYNQVMCLRGVGGSSLNCLTQQPPERSLCRARHPTGTSGSRYFPAFSGQREMSESGRSGKMNDTNASALGVTGKDRLIGNKLGPTTSSRGDRIPRILEFDDFWLHVLSLPWHFRFLAIFSPVV